MQNLVARHVELTGSRLGARLLSDWPSTGSQFTKVMPRDYKRALATDQGLTTVGPLVAHG